MEWEFGVGLGLYVSGIVLLVRTIEEIAKVKKWWHARVISIVLLVFLGGLFMFYTNNS